MHCLRPFCFLLLVCASLATSAQAPTWSEDINLDPSLSVEESEAKLGWDVYPNPTTDQLRVDFPTGIPGADVVLTDAAGKIALEAHIQPGQPLDVQALPAGVYHVRLRAAHRMYTSTLIKN